MNKKYSLNHKTRQEVEKHLLKTPIIILPIGATEQHGYHLPLGTDTIISEYLSYRVSEQIGSLVAPPLHYGYSWVWRDIPGTMSVEQDHLEDTLKDLAHSVSRYGTKLFVIINGHDSNTATMKYACREFNDENPMKLLYCFYPKINAIYQEYCSSPMWQGMFHADEFETSMMLAINENLVQMEKAVEEYPEIPKLYGYSALSLGDISNSGVYGNPLLASKQKGIDMLEKFSYEIASLIKESMESTDV